MKHDESELIIRIMGGDQGDYAILIDRYKEGLYRHCFKFVRDEDIAEDLAQDTFIQAFLQLNTYNHNFRFSTWLYKIGTNIALQHLRRKQPLRLEDDDIAAIVSTLPATDQQAKDNELRAATRKLPANHQRVVSLYYWEGKNYQQIADTMQTTTGTIKAWMYRAKKQLKEMLS